MSKERREKQTRRRDGELPFLVQRYWKSMLKLIGVAGLLDLLKEGMRHELISWLMPRLGVVGTWLIGNPVALFTAAFIGIALWLAGRVCREALIEHRESSLIDYQTQRPILRRKLNISRFVTAVALGILITSWGLYSYLHSPLQEIIIDSNREFVGRNTHNADAYVAIIFTNYSNQPVQVKTDGRMTAFGRTIPQSPDATVSEGFSVGPKSEFTIHFPIWFQNDQLLRDAFNSNQVLVFVSVAYNNGKRDVIFEYEGRVMSDIGHVEAIKTGWKEQS